MTTVAVTSVQKGLTLLGHTPGPIDGRWGPQTGDALKLFLMERGAATKVTPNAAGSKVDIENAGAALKLKNAAREWDAYGADPVAPTVAPSTAAAAAPLAIAQPFWRWESPGAWLLAVLGASLVGGVGYSLWRGRKKRRRRR